MSDNLEAIAELEIGDLYIELVVDCNLYYEPADPSVGIMSGDFSADGYEMVSVQAWYDGESVWESTDQGDMGLALAYLARAGHNCEELIESACDKEISNYDPRDSICYAP